MVKIATMKQYTKNINNYKTNDLRKIVGVVTQESILFHDTIKNNITFGTDKFDEVVKAEVQRNSMACQGW